jgi:hypothetical protein
VPLKTLEPFVVRVDNATGVGLSQLLGHATDWRFFFVGTQWWWWLLVRGRA